MPPYLGWEDAFELIFDGGRITEAELAGLELQPSEIKRVRLCTLAEAADLVTPLSHRRLTVAAALAARRIRLPGRRHPAGRDATCRRQAREG